MRTQEAAPTQITDQADRELKARHRGMWASGDYPAVARELIGSLGERLVQACGISAGQRVLDVAAGSGNTAIAAAETGASVVAADLTPELFEPGRRDAAARGVEVEWIEADAEAMPFENGEFDVVVSSVGAMFAPRHGLVAEELVRVTRPGGTIGMISWTPEGFLGGLLRVLAPYAPPLPPFAQPPVLWGSEEHVRELLGDRVSSLELTRETLAVERFPDPLDLRGYFKEKYGPVIATYANNASDPDRVDQLDQDFADLVNKWNRGAPGGPAHFDFEYLLAVARKNP